MKKKNQEKKVHQNSLKNKEGRLKQILLYLSAVIVGGYLGIVDPEDGWIYTVGIMIIYAILGRFVDREDFSAYEFADSVYYLGFTYTLIMLAGILIYLDIPTTTMIDYFGTAVVTSIVGIVMRSGIQMFYMKPEETMEHANERINEAVKDFIQNLSVLNSELTKEVDDETGLKKSLNELNNKFNNLAEAQTESIEKVNEQMEGVNKKFKTAKEELAGFIKKIADLNTTLKNSNQEIEKLIPQKSTRTNGEPGSLVVLKKNLTDLSDATENVLEEVNNSLDTFRKANFNIRDQFAETKKIGAYVEEIMREVEDALEHKLEQKIEFKK